MNSTECMKMAAFQELKDALRVKKVNDELLEFLASSLRWILHYGERHSIPLPEKDKIIELMDRAIEIEKKLPSQYISDDFLQRDKNKDNRQGLHITGYNTQPHIDVIVLMRTRSLSSKSKILRVQNIRGSSHLLLPQQGV